MRKNSNKTKAQKLRARLNKRTVGIEVEHRDSWGDELRCNMSSRLLAEATTSNRSWLVIITIYWNSPSGAYYDSYKYEFQSCTLTDDKSIEKFDAIRDHILSVEKARGNESQYEDWGWKATPWSSKHKYTEPGEEILVACFTKE